MYMYFGAEVHYKEVVMLESLGVDAWGEPIDVDLSQHTEQLAE